MVGLSAPVLRGVVADLGGTNARFAIAAIAPDRAVALESPAGMRARDYETPQSALSAYLNTLGRPRVDFAAVAGAGPVRNGEIALTNLGWTVSPAAIASTAGVDRVELLNDLAAVAWAAPVLGEGDLRRIGPMPFAGGVVAVLGAGTGTNCAALVSGPDGRPVVVGGEGGHISFAPTTEQEIAIWRQLASRFGRVSVERVASGPGLLNLYQALCAIDGTDCRAETPEGVSTLAEAGDGTARESLDCFAEILGAVGGDFALTFGAGALYLAGGIAPGLIAGERAAAFRRRFDAKGRFQDYMGAISTAVIVHPHAALIGAARAVAERMGRD